MLDKIVVLSSRKQAVMVFTDRSPVTVSSDVDVVPLLMWFLSCPTAKLVTKYPHNVVGIELRRDTSNEVTVKIDLKEVA